MVVHVKFMALNDEGKIAEGIITDSPSVMAVRDKLEDMGAAVIYAEEATDEEVAELRAEKERGEQ